MGIVTSAVCAEEGCDRPFYARGLCKSHYNTLWNAEHPGKMAEWQKAKRQRHPEYWIPANYPGFSYPQWLQMFDAQNGRCKVCGTSARLDIDHDHATGAIRGLICRGCNVRIGKVEMNPGWATTRLTQLTGELQRLRAVLAYLEMEVE